MLVLRHSRRFCHSCGDSCGALGATIAKSDSHSAVLKHVPKSKPLALSALAKLKSEKDPEKLFNLFKENAHNKLVIENRFAFEDTVSRLAGAKRFDYIEHLLEHQKSLPQGSREGFIVRVIVLYGKAGMTKHALDTFYDMHLYGCKRTVKSYNAALCVLARTRNVKAIEAFVQDVPVKYDVALDIYSCNIVIKAFCEIGMLEKAYLIMVHMERLGIMPDVITYTTLMSAFYKDRRWVVGNGLWNLMVLKGCSPNLATFNVRIQFLVNARRAWEANDLLKLLPKLGITPDEVTYNLVIKGFYLAGFPEMATRVYDAFHGQGNKPNAKIYHTMIHRLCKGAEFDRAYRMSLDSMRKKWFPNVQTIGMLLNGLMKNRQIDKANLVMALVRRKKPSFPSDELKSLQSLIERD